MNSDNGGMGVFWIKWFKVLIWVYFTYLLLWFLGYVFTGDRFGIVGFVNSIAVWLFVPLALLLPYALVVRKKELISGCLVIFIVFLWIWGDLFIPKTSRIFPDHTPLRVMTYNVLGTHTTITPTLDVIKKSDADIVFLQELNYPLANALARDLSAAYPHQRFLPENGVRGMGIISKLPLTATEMTLPHDWVGPPQVYKVMWENREVVLVNFHMWPLGVMQPAQLSQNFRAREVQAETLARFVAQQSDPVIVAGDANTVPLSDAYKIITVELKDTWKEAGYGFGHTFPGSAFEGGSRPKVMGVPSPKWMARIDYVFVTDDWDVVTTKTAPFDGISDHRGVIAELSFKP